MIKQPLESQDELLYLTPPTLSIILTLSSTTSQPLQNCQTLQRFLSPLYSLISLPVIIYSLISLPIIIHSLISPPVLIQSYQSTCSNIVLLVHLFLYIVSSVYLSSYSI